LSLTYKNYLDVCGKILNDTFEIPFNEDLLLIKASAEQLYFNVELKDVVNNLQDAHAEEDTLAELIQYLPRSQIKTTLGLGLKKEQQEVEVKIRNLAQQFNDIAFQDYLWQKIAMVYEDSEWFKDPKYCKGRVTLRW
jgi:cell division FtsZ-interacting protein ZapD